MPKASALQDDPVAQPVGSFAGFLAWLDGGSGAPSAKAVIDARGLDWTIALLTQGKIDVDAATLPGRVSKDLIVAMGVETARKQMGRDRWYLFAIREKTLGDLGTFEIYEDSQYFGAAMSQVIIRRPTGSTSYRWSTRQDRFVGGQAVGQIVREGAKAPPLVEGSTRPPRTKKSPIGASVQNQGLAYAEWILSHGPAAHLAETFPGVPPTIFLGWSIVELPGGRLQPYVSDGFVLFPGMYPRVRKVMDSQFGSGSEQAQLRKLRDAATDAINAPIPPSQSVSLQLRGIATAYVRDPFLPPDVLRKVLSPAWSSGLTESWVDPSRLPRTVENGREWLHVGGQAYSAVFVEAARSALGQAVVWVSPDKMLLLRDPDQTSYAVVAPKRQDTP